MKPTTFRSAKDFRGWLEAHHDAVTELIVRCFKSHARTLGVTHPEALDEALCFGWIDGVRRSLDADSFSVRFTPRKPKSAWSKVNVKRARELEAEGRMRPPGRAAFERRVASQYSFESRPVTLPPRFEKRLRSDPKAWAFWRAQPPWYRRTCAFWVVSAKKEETRVRRFAKLLACCAHRRTIAPLTRAKK